MEEIHQTDFLDQKKTKQNKSNMRKELGIRDMVVKATPQKWQL